MKLSQNEIEYLTACTEEVLNSAEVQSMDLYMQHGHTTCLQHCMAVAYYSYLLCRRLKLNCDYRSVVRGALLHDFFLYDWHTKDKSHRLHGFTHPKTALTNAEFYFELNKIERDIIRKHMWPLTIHLPMYKESVSICIVDKICTVAETFSPYWRLVSYKSNLFECMQALTESELRCTD